MKENSKICGERKKVLFGSVIYHDVLQYFNEFIDSIERQTIDNFEILLLNDGIPEEEFKNRIYPIQRRCRIIQYGIKYTPAQLRVKLIQEAKKYGADILVIGDADDLFSNNRIESTVITFKTYSDAAFAYNECRLFNGNSVMTEIPEQLSDIKEIAERNFLGMSNTAIRISVLDNQFIDTLWECDSFVFDWYLYTRMLLEGYKGVKVKEAYTLYRLHDRNFAGLPVISKESIRREIEIKIKHYGLLRKRDSLFERLYNCYCEGKIQRKRQARDINSNYYWWNFTEVVEE